MPSIPEKERDIPNPPELVREVLSRDGYFCRVPGCGKLAEECHHIRWRRHGGRTTRENSVSLCMAHHDLVHDGAILMSGTAEDLRISDRYCRPLQILPKDQSPSVVLEVERQEKPQGTPEALAEAPPSAPSAAPRLDLPQEITPEWLAAHRQHLAWNDRRGALVFHPEADGESTLPARPAAPAPSAGTLDGFRGQERAVRNLALAVRGARVRIGTPLPLLLSGPPGVGKTTLALRAAAERGTRLHTTSGPALKDLGALVGLLTSLGPNDVLFIDEIHALPTLVAESFYQAIDERKLSLPVICGVETRTVVLSLEPFFLIGATTEESRLPKPLHSRFGTRERLDLYSTADLEEIALERGPSLGVEVTREGARRLAGGSRGTPRALLASLHRARDLAQVENGRADGAVITLRIAALALEAQGIDDAGLTELDRRLLGLLDEKGRPLGLRTLGDLLGESERTLLEVIEPYLVREGFLIRTRRGRVITERGRSHARRAS